MGNATTYFLNQLAGGIFGSSGYTLPSSYYIGLSRTTPNVGGTNVSEPSTSAGYARVLLPAMSVPSGGTVRNPNMISFPESTGSWGTVTHWLLFDAASGGHLCLYGALENSKTVNAQSALSIRPSELELFITQASV